MNKEREAEKKAAAESADEADDEPAPTSDAEPPEDEIKKKHKKGRGKGSGGIKVPEDWPWEEAKKLFEQPDVVPADQLELEWKNPDVDGLVQFLVQEKGFK
jgi:flap endonuclease-1